MKLYTEEQVMEMLSMTDSMDIDGELLTHNDIISSQKPIELPTDWEIEQFAEDSFHTCTNDLHYEGIILGAKWVIDKIKNQQ